MQRTRLVYGSCRHKHKTSQAAERCLSRAIRRYRRIPGGNSFCPWQVVGVGIDGKVVPRREWDYALMCDEEERAAYARDHADDV